MADAFQSTPGAASDGTIATVSSTLSGVLGNLGKLATDALADQWGLNKGNGIDQQLYNPQTTTPQTTKVGLVDVTASPNTILTLAIVGIALFFAFRG